MKKEFTYLDLTFVPIKELKGRSAHFLIVSKRVKGTGMTPMGWNYESFYEKAEEVGASNYDLFKVKGKTVLPGEHELYEYSRFWWLKSLVEVVLES